MSDRDLVTLYEDEDLLVLDKAPGDHLNETDTSRTLSLVERIRPSIPDIHVVHRLDRETSGVVLLAKNAQAARSLSEGFRDRRTKKIYVAIAEGAIDAMEIDAPIGPDSRRPRARRVHPAGKPAKTRITPLGRLGPLSSVVAEPITGRTHQIRVHLAHVGAPIAGDRLYGGPTAVRIGTEIVRFERVMLHARRLTVELRGRELTFEAPLPDDMVAIGRMGLVF